MKTANDIAVLVDDLAGQWTEPALEILKATGVRPISVDVELEAWRTLKNVLRSELCGQQAFQASTQASLSTVKEQVLPRAALLVARKLEPESISSDFESQVRRLAGDRPSTPSEHHLYAEIVRQLALRAAFKPPSRRIFSHGSGFRPSPDYFDAVPAI
jgi:hypothetical protein